MSQISVPKTMNTNLLLFLLHTVDVDFHMFTLAIILYKKVMPAMLSPFRDHIAGDYIEM